MGISNNTAMRWVDKNVKLLCLGALAIAVAALAVIAFSDVRSTAVAGGTSPNPVPTFGGESAPAAASLSIPDNATVLIIGDSYTQGYGSDDPATQGYAPVLSAAMGWNSTINGIGRTGHVAGGLEAGEGPNAYASRLRTLATTTPAPDLVIMQGSQNDYVAQPDEIRAATNSDIQLVKDQWPNTSVLLIGPSAPQPQGDTYAAISAAIGDAATDSGVSFISPIRERWMTAANATDYAFTDGTHLNTAGHAYLAAKLQEKISELNG